MAKLTLPPDKQGYSVKEQPQVVHVPLEGGLGWFRRDMVGGATRFIDVRWTVGREGFQTLEAFFEENIAEDCPPFEIDLFGPLATLLEYTAQLVEDSYGLNRIDGHTFEVSAQLEVWPLDSESTTWPAGIAGKLELAPDQANYSTRLGSESASVRHEGNAGNYRRSYFNAARRVTVLWYCDANEYEYLQEAYRSWVASGGVPFLIDLILQTPDLVEHKACFIPGSFGLRSHSGLSYTVGAELEVEPTPNPGPFTFHGASAGGGGGNGNANGDPVLAWFAPANAPGGVLVRTNSGVGDLSDFTTNSHTTLYAGLDNWTGQTLVWSLIWTSPGGHASPTISDSYDNVVVISWPNWGGEEMPPPVYDPSIGTLIVTATINGTPVAVGQRLEAVSAPPVIDYPTVTWGPE